MECFLTPCLFTSFWPKPIFLSQCLPASIAFLNIGICDTFAQAIQMDLSKMMFCTRHLISCTFKDAAMITLSQAPQLTINSQSNLQHLSLLSPKASIYHASMVGKQASSDVLQRIQSRTDSIQLGYSGNTCWEHMPGFWEQQGTHM